MNLRVCLITEKGVVIILPTDIFFLIFSSCGYAGEFGGGSKTSK